MEKSPAAPAVLVIEDDEAVAGYLSDNLSADGFRVSCARSAGAGLRAVEVRRPDLLLLDLVLGDASGLAVLDRIRAADGLGSRATRRCPCWFSPAAPPRPTACAGSRA